MIARNAVILIDQIETERSQGRDIWDAVVEATLSRFRPIMLTAISTVLGLIPIAQTVFWGPMAFAIMGGLFVATMLTPPVLPVFYITLPGEVACGGGRLTVPSPSGEGGAKRRMGRAATSRGPLPPGILKGSLPGNSWSYNCRPIVEAGQALMVDDTRLSSIAPSP
jgi:predicted RND superfamily exporter protein